MRNISRPLTSEEPYCGYSRSGPDRTGFTLIELLVVIGTLGLLAVLSLPAMDGARSHGQAFQCLNNTKRLTAGWLMYAADNNDRLMLCSAMGSSPGWIGGNMDWLGSSDNTNVDNLLNPAKALMANYVKSASLYKCPADTFVGPSSPAVRVRSYSMNAGVGLGGLTPYTGYPQYPLGRTYSGKGAMLMSQLKTPGPASVWVILDEHPDSITDGDFKLDPGFPPGTYYWRDMPASLHGGAGSFSFADGHSEIHRWLERGRKHPTMGALVQTTVLPVIFMDFPMGVPGANLGSGHLPCMYSQDYAWMNDGMPYH